MVQSERIDIEPIRKLLRTVSLDRANELDVLLDERALVCELDRETDCNLFQAILGSPNIVKIGLKCTIRLQAHAYAGGIVIAAIGKPSEWDTLVAPANRILTWAVGVDLQRWLGRRGFKVKLEQVLPGGDSELPEDILGSLSETQRTLGEGLFRYASAFILLHELGHLKFGHTCSTHENEKEADRFAAEWMSEAAFESSGDIESNRLVALFGIAVSLLWFTIFNIYFGQKKSNTHPEGYDRLSQVLDQVIDGDDEEECQ